MACHRCFDQHGLFRGLLLFRYRQHCLAFVRVLPHGGPSHGHNDVNFVVLGIQHHRLFHVPNSDGEHDPVRNFRLLCRNLHDGLRLHLLLLPRG